MRQLLTRLVAVALLLGTASCTNDGPDYVWLRTIHAVPDAPALRVSFDRYVFRTTLTFGNSSQEVGDALLSDSADLARMSLDYFGPGNEGVVPLFNLDVPIAKDGSSTVVLAGNFDDIQPIIVTGPRRPRPLDSAWFQFVHAAAAEPALDVYVTAPDTELSSTAPNATVQPLTPSPSFEVPFGALRIRLTVAGTLNVLMDTGEISFPQQSGSAGTGGEWLFAITPNVAPGPSPLFMILSSSRTTSTLYNTGTAASLRAFHGLRGQGPVDLVADTEPPQPLLDGLAFQSRSPLVPAPVGQYGLLFTPSGEPEQELANRVGAFGLGQQYAAFLFGVIDTRQITLVNSETRSVATEAKLRFAHLAGDGGLFSLYLTEAEDEERGAANRLFGNVSVGTVTTHVAIRPAEYFLTLTRRTSADGEETVVQGPQAFPLQGGDVLTFVAYPAGTEGDPEIIELIDDLLP